MTVCITKYIILVILSIVRVSRGQLQVPCYFVFGDSLFDNGNNNNLITLGKANYLPYGIDYYYGATGIFTNGKNIPKLLAERIGFLNPIPPFAMVGGANSIVQGVNYASAAAGILDQTSYQLGDRVFMNRQLKNHEGTVNQIGVILGNKTATNNLLNQCLYSVSMGNSDYLNNYYFRPPVTLDALLTPEAFAQKLINQYSQQLTTLYNLEARKVAVFGVGPIGCIPNSVSENPTNIASGCVDSFNIAAQIFNNKLISLINNLNTNLSGAHFTYINLYGILTADLSAIGITIPKTPCCEVSKLTAGFCVRNGGACSNRNVYAYFDNYNPTQVVCNYTVSRAFNAQSPTDATPTDIVTLLRQ